MVDEDDPELARIRDRIAQVSDDQIEIALAESAAAREAEAAQYSFWHAWRVAGCRKRAAIATPHD